MLPLQLDILVTEEYKPVLKAVIHGLNV